MRLCICDGDKVVEQLEVGDKITYKDKEYRLIEIVKPRWGAKDGAVVLSNGVAYTPAQIKAKWVD